jgi:3D (Asp-Asp-Asp) domain-containing protein
MKTRKQFLVAVAVLLTIAFSTTISAQAGFLDWFKSNGTQAEQSKNGSFDQLYGSVLTSAQEKDSHLALMANAVAPLNSPAGAGAKVVRQTYTVQLSGYNSEVGQTDDSPFITAANTHVRWGIVAANIIDANGRNIPFGTIIKIPALYGDQIFVVEDRMNKRYTRNVDIWFESHADALKLGRRTVQIEVIR